MTDLHTHILPGVDDGAENSETSINMLRMERDQGIDTVVLTPHFYCEEESPERFLKRRQASFDRLQFKISELPEEERNSLPQLKLGAEVTWWPNMANCEELSELCIENTKTLLLEMPSGPWNRQVFDEVYNLMGKTGITPVIAHIDRYLNDQHPGCIMELLDIGTPIQLGSEAVLNPWRRRKAINLVKHGLVHMIATDCHDCTRRPPNMKYAIEILQKKVGKEAVDSILQYAKKVSEIN